MKEKNALCSTNVFMCDRVSKFEIRLEYCDVMSVHTAVHSVVFARTK